MTNSSHFSLPSDNDLNLFINKYSIYLSHCIKSGLLKNKISVYFRTEKFNQISNWTIEKLYQTHYYSKDLFNQYIFKEESGRMGYVRTAAGLLLIYVTDREYLTYPILSKQPEIIGVFFPACSQQIQNISRQEIMDILKWKGKDKYCLENWG